MRFKLPLRVQLPLLVAGTTLPLILFAAALVHLNYSRDREAAFDRVLDTVRGMQLVVDREMLTITSALQILALSDALRRDDRPSFRRDVDVFVQQYPGSAVVVADRAGRQIMNSRVPEGTELPALADTTTIERAITTGKPAYSDLFTGSVSQRRLVTIAVPVVGDVSPVAAISFSPPLSMFQTIVEEQRPSEAWTVSIFDRTGTNFARVPNPQQTIGQRASPTLYAALFARPEAKLITTSLEGTELITAFTRSRLTGWTVAAGVSTASLTQPLWHALAITAAAGLIMLSVGLAFAVSMATRIARAEALHELLLAEVNHRVKNTLATVQSIVLQTFRSTADPIEARRKLDGRLLALGRAHTILSDQKWESAGVAQIVGSVLDPYVTEKDRVTLSGPSLDLSSRAALMVSLILHELATNAVKYGALSNRTGRIAITWSAEDGGKRLKLVWQETGGPPVQEPERKGFGSRLIEQAFAHQLGGKAEVEFNASGLRCVLDCPVT